MHIADSNSMHPLLHAALGDSDYSCFQANFDEADLYESDSQPVFYYNQTARTRKTLNSATLAS